MVTQRVTGLLNVLAGVTVFLMLWNAYQVSQNCKRYATSLVLCTLILAVAVVGLCVVHRQLDMVINVEAVEITDREIFSINHRRYNQLTTVEWIATLAYLPVTVAAWRKVDGGRQAIRVGDESVA